MACGCLETLRGWVPCVLGGRVLGHVGSTRLVEAFGKSGMRGRSGMTCMSGSCGMSGMTHEMKP